MKLSTILSTLAEARLPSVTADQLRQLVGTQEGKDFADDIRWYGAGEVKRRDAIAAVVYALAPGVRSTVEQLGFEFDLLTIIGTAKRGGAPVIKALTTRSSTHAGKIEAATILHNAGLKAIVATGQTSTTAPIDPPYYNYIHQKV